MNITPDCSSKAHRLAKGAGLLLGWALLLSPAAVVAEQAEIVAVASRVGDDYVRTKLADGSFQAETYAFGEGGVWNNPMRDAALERMKFLEVAQTIAGPLAAQNYLPAKSSKEAKLLIVLYWGMTAGSRAPYGTSANQTLPSVLVPPAPEPSVAGAVATATPAGNGASGASNAVTDANRDAMDAFYALSAMENRQRDRANWSNAGILGFDTELNATQGYELTAMRAQRQNLMEEIEDNRYFVVLMAYDFQILWKEKKHKLVWETRFSIRERGSRFDQQLAAMAQTASRYFGQDSHGLRRRPLPDGQVTLGKMDVIGVEPAK